MRAPVRAVVRAWDRFWFEPVSTAPMSLLRIAWGLLSSLWALSLLADVDPFLVDGALRYDLPPSPGGWSPLQWTSWSGAPIAVCLLLLVASMATLVGYRSRLSSVVAVLCMLALQRANPLVFNSGDLVLRQVGVAVALSPTGLVLSVDAWRARREGAAAPPWRSPWPIRLLQLQVALGYALSAWAKVRGTTWQDGTAVARALRIEDLQRFVLPTGWIESTGWMQVLTWGTLAFEASFLVLVWNRRLRPWVLGAGALFHLGIDATFDVGFFSWAMLAAYIAFIPPQVADRWLLRISARSDLSALSQPRPSRCLVGDDGD